MLLRQLVLYGRRDMWLPCTERSYYGRPYAIKNQLAEQHHDLGPDLGLRVTHSGPVLAGLAVDTIEAGDMISTYQIYLLALTLISVKTNDGKSRKFVSLEPENLRYWDSGTYTDTLWVLLGRQGPT